MPEGTRQNQEGTDLALVFEAGKERFTVLLGQPITMAAVDRPCMGVAGRSQDAGFKLALRKEEK
jgi:hypothetical protein